MPMLKRDIDSKSLKLLVKAERAIEQYVNLRGPMEDVKALVVEDYLVFYLFPN